eukprot:1196071-Prorocentrum_minimum.AAC.4
MRLWSGPRALQGAIPRALPFIKGQHVPHPSHQPKTTAYISLARFSAALLHLLPYPVSIPPSGQHSPSSLSSPSRSRWRFFSFRRRLPTNQHPPSQRSVRAPPPPPARARALRVDSRDASDIQQSTIQRRTGTARDISPLAGQGDLVARFN